LLLSQFAGEFAAFLFVYAFCSIATLPHLLVAVTEKKIKQKKLKNKKIKKQKNKKNQN